MPYGIIWIFDNTGSGDNLALVQCQAISWTNADLLSGGLNNKF